MRAFEPGAEVSSRRGVPSARRSQSRRGSAAVEFAVCLPVIVLLIFGSIEASAFIFLKQTLNVAGYEAVREACKSGGTSTEAMARAEAILGSRRVADYDVRFPAGDITMIPRGEPVVCEVSAPTQSNSPLAGQFVKNRTLTARVVMLKE
ncbi:pilus assembly protein [Roseiconus nitratireducens]|uniref:Pilus assembly protein n=1 Tax=Roseiconus nitratireducens TaxID=2605748 RepID=A0A5M6CYU3_9BACT|nr:TadE family protein [Roseiconus nitratireducens]KAA5540397.1 pilus assembly protein [Roseiconus nitratireducens]